MPSAADGPRLAALLIVALITTACQPSGSPTADVPAVSAAPSAPPPPGTAVASLAPGGIVLPTPGRPYDAGDVLVAMRESRRPGGVPGELEQEAIAAAVAAELWTFDGEAWPEIVAGGSCGAETCTLELAGTPDGAVGEDLYLFEVRVATATLEGVFPALRGFPEPLLAELDAWARGHWPDQPLPGVLASGRWLPPPEPGRFVLSYRAGGEEGSPAVDAVLDLAAETVELRAPG